MIKANGDRYEGEFKNFKKWGYGIEELKDGSKYEGQWNDDIKDGPGILTLNNDDVYEGTFVKGLKHGKGKRKWTGKDNQWRIYEGDW